MAGDVVVRAEGLARGFFYLAVAGSAAGYCRGGCRLVQYSASKR
jgi:hypothetical protein